LAFTEAISKNKRIKNVRISIKLGGKDNK
jgi:hypothetical protein